MQRLLTIYGLDLDDETTLNFLKVLGSIYRDAHRYPESIRCFQDGLALARRIENQQATIIHLNGLGWAQWRHLQYQRQYTDKVGWIEAEVSVLEAFDLAKRLGDKHGMAQSLHNQSIIIRGRDRDLSRSLELIEQSVGLFEEIDDTVGLIGAYFDMGVTFDALGMLSKAKETSLKSLSIAQRIGNQTVIHYVLNLLQLLALHKGDWTQFSQYMQESLKYVTHPKHLFHIMTTYGRGVLAFHNQDYSLLETLSEPFLTQTPKHLDRFTWLIRCQRGLAALMQDDTAMLTRCIIKCSALDPNIILDLDRSYLWLLYAGKALLENQIQLGATWFGHCQAHSPTQGRSISRAGPHVADVVDQIHAKFQSELATPQAIKAAEIGASISPDTLFSHWFQIAVQDEAGLEEALMVIERADE